MHVTARYGIGDLKKKNEMKIKKKNLVGKLFLAVGTSKKQKISFFRRFFLRFCFGFRADFSDYFWPFFSFFISLHVKLRFLSVRVKLAEMRHRPTFIKSCDGCPELKKLRKKNIFGLEDFSGQKKSEYFAFFIL